MFEKKMFEGVFRGRGVGVVNIEKDRYLEASRNFNPSCGGTIRIFDFMRINPPFPP